MGTVDLGGVEPGDGTLQVVDGLPGAFGQLPRGNVPAANGITNSRTAGRSDTVSRCFSWARATQGPPNRMRSAASCTTPTYSGGFSASRTCCRSTRYASRRANSCAGSRGSTALKSSRAWSLVWSRPLNVRDGGGTHPHRVALQLGDVEQPRGERAPVPLPPASPTWLSHAHQGLHVSLVRAVAVAGEGAQPAGTDGADTRHERRLPARPRTVPQTKRNVLVTASKMSWNASARSRTGLAPETRTTWSVLPGMGM